MLENGLRVVNIWDPNTTQAPDTDDGLKQVEAIASRLEAISTSSKKLVGWRSQNTETPGDGTCAEASVAAFWCGIRGRRPCPWPSLWVLSQTPRPGR